MPDDKLSIKEVFEAGVNFVKDVAAGVERVEESAAKAITHEIRDYNAAHGNPAPSGGEKSHETHNNTAPNQQGTPNKQGTFQRPRILG